MAIRIITGVPGSGKSFYAVKHLRDGYYRYNKEQDHWEIKKGVTVIANIDSLKLEHLNLDEILSEANITIKDFFTVEYQEKVKKKYRRVVYFIDECQRYFPRKFYDEKVFYYFQYHRHLGHDIYLMTQSIGLLPKEIRELAELEIRGARRGLSIFGEFKYKVMANNEIIDHKMLKKNREVFRLYRSMDQKEVERIRNPLVKYLVACLIIGLIGTCAFKKTFFGGVLDKEKMLVKKEERKPVPRKWNPDVKRSAPSNEMKFKGQFVPVELSYYQMGKRLEIVDYYTGTRIPVKWATYDVFAQNVGDRVRLWALIPKSKYKPKNIENVEETKTVETTGDNDRGKGEKSSLIFPTRSRSRGNPDEKENG